MAGQLKKTEIKPTAYQPVIEYIHSGSFFSLSKLRMQVVFACNTDAEDRYCHPSAIISGRHTSDLDCML